MTNITTRDLQSMAERQLSPKQLAIYEEFRDRIVSSNLVFEDKERALKGHICVLMHGF